MTDPAVFFTDDELEVMKARAWRRAAAAWQEARAPGLSNSVRLMLMHDAEGEEATWDRLQHEYLRRRDTHTQEVRP